MVQVDKPNSQLVFQDLPYYIEGDVKISEHDCIMRQICRKHKPELLGKSEKDIAEVDNFFSAFIKLKCVLIRVCLQRNRGDKGRMS